MILKSSKDSRSKITLNQIIKILSNFGEIQNVYENHVTKNGYSLCWIANFYDIRNCRESIKSRSILFNDEIISFDFFFNENEIRLQSICKNLVSKSFNQSTSNHSILNQPLMLPHMNQSPSENLKFNKLTMQFKNPKPVDDTTLFQFIKDHGESKARSKYGVGIDRIKRVQRQIGLHIKRRRKTTKEQDDCICDTASENLLFSKQIKRIVQKKYRSLKISSSTVIRRLKERKFKYKKPKHIQKLSQANKYSLYNFSVNMINNYEDDFPIIIFSDESRFC